MNKSLSLILGCAIVALSPSAWALSASTQAAVNNNYLFIENNVDKEYFITPSSLAPRISGSSTWVKYGKNQDSLGYIGIVDWVADTKYYKDMWIDNSPIIEPFRGIRCNKGANCPSSGYIAALTDRFGFYHAKATGLTSTGGYYGFASLTDSAYEYFRNIPVGSAETYNLNFCRTTIDYDYAAGQRCKDQSSGNWFIKPYTLNKIGHLSLVSTNAFQELWVASDGTPSVIKDNGYCELGVLGGKNGIICKMISYNLNQTRNLTALLKFQMYADSGLLGFTPKADSIKYSGDGKNWTNFSSKANFYKIFSNGSKYVYVFLSKTFLKKMVDSGVSITNTQPFTFAFTNGITPESGYYQFTPSLRINIVPKEYGISIISSGSSTSASGSGIIGEATPITMDYTVTVSGPRQADSITAQVIGENTTINGVPYCLFTSVQGRLSVPIPAFLQYNSESGGVVQKRNSCNEAAISMRDALWQQTPWDANNNDDGSYYAADLKLIFPMNDSRSALTDSGADWEGVVSASGEIKVTANWVGVSR